MIERKQIDWIKTGRNLQLLRNDNLCLRKVSCRDRNYDKQNCDGDCDGCRFDMDNSISRKELAELFGVSENVIYSWEKGKTPIGIEELLLYCQITQLNILDILVFV